MNSSGIYPTGNRVLVKPDKIDDTTDGGIYIPQSVTDRHQQSATYGTVVALGPDCFMHKVEVIERYMNERWKPIEKRTTGYSQPFAEVGDRVAFAIYSGLNYTGEDGAEYKEINDEDITAKVTDAVVQTSIEARKAM